MANFKCPVCNQGELIEGESGVYLCNHFKSMDDKCSFRIFKTYFKKTMTNEIVKELCENGETKFFDDLISKEDKVFGAKLGIVDGFVKPLFENSGEQEILGVSCPRCDKNVIVTGKGYVCEDYFDNKKCDFYLGNKIAEVEISKDDAKVLINGGSTEYRTDFISNNGNEFGAKLLLDEDCKLKFDFEVAKCPKCKTGSISSSAKAYGCSNFRDENIKCDFVIWRQIKGAEINLKNVLELCLNGGLSSEIKFKDKEKGDFKGKLQLSENYKVEIV